ncbi:uncharacterized protein F4807DRAFT_409261 [Annulohypoxylon truncatum]|uniref:uncharacterized protein n=1 Tax=Annulohypoxylon truncatum TaxID=327061 RepID=UPI002008A050|nr:uncharacterized protein F4807DRAFT_409261 [Annulohypoxylon truncatum]KAI1213823.1 hypothetical protein F4807DRAFT_409261 [Annulohypoxylon truncatum]
MRLGALKNELKLACFLTYSLLSEVADIIKVIKLYGLLSKVATCGSGVLCSTSTLSEHVLASPSLILLPCTRKIFTGTAGS